MSEQRYPIQSVLPYARDLVARLAPSCSQIAIAGSLRREARMVKDIEIVAAPLPARHAPEFGARQKPPANALEETLLLLEQQNAITRHTAVDPRLWRWGERYKKLALVEHGRRLPFKVDLFIVLEPAQWGPILAIRTGPGDFNQAIMTHVLPRRGLAQTEGHLEAPSGHVLETPTEADYFVALGMPLIPPQNRKAWVVHKTLERITRFEDRAPAPESEPVQPGLF